MITTPAAQREFLQGEYFRDQGGEHTQQAVPYFEHAIKIDPHYAPAWVALSDAHVTLAGSNLLPVETGYRMALAEVQRALQLNPDLAEAHALMGNIRLLHLRDWTGADQSIQQALALAPGSDGVIRSAAFHARSLGRLDWAIELYRRAIEINPTYFNGYKNFGITLYYAGKQQQAAEALRKALELRPTARLAHAYLGLLNLAASRPLEALDEAAKEPESGFRLSVLAIAHYAQGHRTESDRNLTELIAKQGKEDYSYQIAEVYAFRGEPELAFEWLERADKENSDSLPEIVADPLLANIRHDPRYTALLKKLHAPL